MINYYKLLDIPDFSDLQTVKSAYRKKAKLFHPDLNQGSENEEIFKWINKAYSALSNPVSKISYDQKLRSALSLNLQPDPKVKRSRISKEDLKSWAIRAEKEEKEAFEKGDKKFPFRFRIMIAISGILSGLFFVYQEWFINQNTYDHFYIIGGLVLFLVSLLFLTQIVYRMLRNLSLYKKSWYSSYENLSVYGFLFLLIIGPIITIQLTQIKKRYHLNHYAETAIAEIIHFTDDDITYEFKTQDGLFIRKNQKLDNFDFVSHAQGWVLIKYSREEPRISELVMRNTSP